MMNRRLSDRLVSFAAACVVTFGLLSGIHVLAASEAAEAAHAAHLAQTGAAGHACAKV